MGQVKPLTELLTKEEIYKLYCETIQENEQLKNRLNHHINDGERKQEIIYKLQRMREQDKENIETTLYEIDILHKKVNPPEHSSIDSQFKRIIDTLKNRW
ncbi:hypothetical protein [Bacillus sp. NTK034]|uniref:hypothetical protein n=1 Tax=Bacillus sp. NTK034 TaxID=2802176 RepID=UPI001A8DFB6F|nr:hypothetical protein [Bacillus sp. NTK034]MBN8200489.1 hypothetical protein [Bacillus sp. NTK034]